MSSSAAGFAAVIAARHDAGAGLVVVTIDPPTEAVQAYHAPGQYIEVVAGPAARGYFALAGDVGAASWELLVRRNGGASDFLLDAPLGAVVTTIGPFGVGFPLARSLGRPLVVAVTGSALAVARPILRERIAHGQAGSTSVYIGARTVRDVALAREVAGWAHAGARVVLCLSKHELGEETSFAEMRRATGYVQHVLVNDMVEGPIRDGLVFAAGSEAMVEELRHMVTAAGLKLEVVGNV